MSLAMIGWLATAVFASSYLFFCLRATRDGGQLGGPTQWATLGVGSATGSERGGRNVNAMATAPRPIPDEAMNSQE